MLVHSAMAAATLPLSLQKGQISSFFSSNHHQRMRVGVTRAGGGYTRVPMDTPGAYQLIDNETGEKFIIWGGEENDPQNSPTPPHQVLSWKPFASKKESSNQLSGSGSIFDSNPGSTSITDEQTRSFGRLKAQKIRHLVKNSLKKKEVSDLPRKQEKRGMAQTKLIEDLQLIANDQEVRRSAVYHHQKDKVSEAQPFMPDLSVSRASSSTFQGWGNRAPMVADRSKVGTISSERRTPIDKGDFFSRKSFRDLGCQEYMIEVLTSLHFLRPSHVQAMSFGNVIGGKSCIIADQSGSGKTLAYLLPLVQRLREEEIKGISQPMAKNPRVIVLVPTAELASQVLGICRSLSKGGVPFRSMVITGGFRQRTQLENLKQDLDVLIATPGRLMFLIKESFLQLSNLKCAVLDEVDILFKDEEFEQAFECLMNTSPITTQYLFVTATLPVDIYNKLVGVFPDCNVVMGPGVHRTSPGLEEVLVDCSGDEASEKTPETAFINKKNALMQLVEENHGTRTIIFCNKIETCRKVENILKRFDRKGSTVRVLPFHAALDQDTRLSNMKEFSNPRMMDGSLFLVCTDRASRGIDFARVDHVVLFDFPRDPSEYVRRVGRTARGAGGRGKAFVFVVGKQVPLARRIIERNMKGHPLHDVPSAYELM